MTITDSAIRFNKATAAELGYPSHVRVLVNKSAKQVAIQACSADEENAVKFSKARRQADRFHQHQGPGRARHHLLVLRAVQPLRG